MAQQSLAQTGVAPIPQQRGRSTARAVLRLAAPAIAQQLLYTLVFLSDRAMLGHYSAAALASLQISGPLAWSVFVVLSAFSAGTIALVGRAVGAGDQGLAAAAVRSSLLYALGTGAVVGLACLAVLDLYMQLFPAAEPAVHKAARAYLQMILAAMPLYLLAFMAGVSLQAAGDTRTPFLVALGGNTLNIALNYILIFGALRAPELGVRGAATASAAAMALEGLLLMGLMACRRGPVTWRGRGGEWAALRRMAPVATASFGERLVQQLGYVGYMAMVGMLGSLAMASHQALLGIEAIAFLSAEGFGIAAAAVVAQNLGAGQTSHAAAGAWVATALGVGLLGSCGLVFVVMPELLLSVFTHDTRLIEAGVPCLYIAAAAQPFMAVALVLSEGLRGAGATRVVLLITLVGGLAVRLGATGLFVFGLGWGLIGVWLGSTVDWIVRASLVALVFLRGRWCSIRI